MTQEQKGLFAKVVAKSWTDSEFKASLLRDPKTVLSEEIADISTRKKVTLHENTDDEIHFVLPAKPPLVGMSSDEILARASQLVEVQLEMFDIMD